MLRESNAALAGAATILVLLGLTAGCGESDGLERVPITGLLTLGGAPLPGAVVQFFPAGETAGPGALGTSDPEGRFEVISSRESDAGIPPGEYTVRVSRLVNPDGTPVPPDAPDADYPGCRESVPRPYSGVDSPLKVVIAPDGGEVRVDVPAKRLASNRVAQ